MPMISLSSSVCGWMIIWYAMYRVFCKFTRCRDPEYMCRIVTLIHATTITLGSFWVTFMSGFNPYLVLGHANTDTQLKIITTSLGYFLYDFAWCLYHQTEGPVMLLHHVVSIVFMTICLHLGVSGTEVVATIFGSEITSIFLNLRWFMKEHSCYTNRTEGFLVDLIFVTLFIGVRIGVGGHLVYCVWRSMTSPLLVKIGGSLFYGVNCIFLCQILSFAAHRLRKWRRSNSSQSPSTKLADAGPAMRPEVAPILKSKLKQRRTHHRVVSNGSSLVSRELVNRSIHEIKTTSLPD